SRSASTVALLCLWSNPSRARGGVTNTSPRRIVTAPVAYIHAVPGGAAWPHGPVLRLAPYMAHRDPIVVSITPLPRWISPAAAANAAMPLGEWITGTPP